MIDDRAFKDYHKFETAIRHKNRFFVNHKFIDSLKLAMSLNSTTKQKDTILYRARIHRYDDDVNSLLVRKKLLNPKHENAIGGRANPDGISYLYLSSDKITCIKEVSPKHNDIITIGNFSLKKDIKLVGFIDPFPTSENNYITSLNHCVRLTFSQSRLSDRPEIDYLPYQFICELIKNEKYDGVLYRSTYDKDILSRSYNIVLFYPKHVALDYSRSSLIKIVSTDYKYYELNKGSTV